ncbi:hypothetical protein AB0758_44565 [Tolypothrix bouteillei VB521301_2]|uniref:hypothetical protein n=1 Tax=Tolypothrix bouteillei TaxID=1246981 RepID=UPI0038B43535
MRDKYRFESLQVSHVRFTTEFKESQIMLLSQLIASQQDQYQAIQAQIEALQEQQRQIQSYLQRLGSVESQMESAAKLMQEAVASIRQECPDELPAYQSLINGFFGQAPIAVLNASVDTDPQPEVTTPAPSDSWTEIDEDIDSYYKANPVVETENTTPWKPLPRSC